MKEYCRMMQLGVIVLCGILILMSFSGCTEANHYRYVGALTSASNDHFFARYSEFDGDRVYTVEVHEDCPIKVEITTTSGKLSLEIATKEGESVYSGNWTEDTSFTVNVSAGSYTIHLIAEKHQGSYQFNWK